MADDKGVRKRKFRKQFYGQKKKSKFELLQPGDKGFLVTCTNGNENKAIREAYDLLTEYSDMIYGVKETDDQRAANEVCSSDDEEEDIELALKTECCQIKGSTDKGGESAAAKRQEQHSSFSRFKAVDCKVRNCCFVKWALNNVKPSHLAFDIMTDLDKTKQAKCRFIQRLLPVDVTCRTFEKDFFESAKILLENEFSVKSLDEAVGQRLTYEVQFKCRNSDVISREMAIRIVGELMISINPTVSVNLSKPDRTVLVEILGKTCCLSVVRDYHSLHRYNVHEIVKAVGCSSSE